MQIKLSKILKTDTTTDLSFPVTYTDGEETVHSFNVFTNTQFRQILKQMFGMRVYDDWEDDTTEAQAITDFLASFTAWKGMRGDTYGRRMYALSIKFEPLENYRSHEEKSGSFTHGESVTLSFENRKDTRQDDSYTERSYDEYTETVKDDSFVTRSYTDYEETYTNGEKTRTENISADDEALTFSPERQAIDAESEDGKAIAGSYTDQKGQTETGNEKTITGSYKDQNGFTAGDVLEKTGSETTEHSGTDEDGYSIDKFGNIGVTTSQQMLASDLDLLKYDIAMQAIKEFVGQYTYLSEGVD